MNAEKFNHEIFKTMTDDEKYDYCASRGYKGINKHGGRKNHKKHPAYLHEKQICCSSINSDNLTGARKDNFNTECDIKTSN